MWSCVRTSVVKYTFLKYKRQTTDLICNLCNISNKYPAMSQYSEVVRKHCGELDEKDQQDVSHKDSPCNDNTESVNAGLPKSLSKRAIKRMKRQQERLEKNEERKAKKKKRHSLTEVDLTQETSYYFENGLRKVYPYTFTFSTYAKGRWVGRKLVEVFCQEFKHYPESVFKEKLQSGQVCVNKSVVGSDYVIKSHDHITHTAHRHEVPVTADPIEILHECPDLLVINKPSSIPCHPCGCFRHNSVTFILSREYGYKSVRFVHRLDRLTSGLLLLAKTNEKAAEISRQVAGRQLQKEYVCRVEGSFPSGLIECREPIGLLSHKLGIQYVSTSGKPAWTTFERISSNGKSSIVRCFPHTGRTHQIRVHLQYLGYPITNDVLYNSDCWGPCKGKSGEFGKSPEEVIALIMRNHDKMKYVIPDLDLLTEVDKKTETDENDATVTNSMETISRRATVSGVDPESAETEKLFPPDSPKCPGTENSRLEDTSVNGPPKKSSPDRPGLDSSKMTYDPSCFDCQRQFKDPRPEDLVMYLHALKYKGPDWEFSSPLPYWAAADWDG